MEKFKESLDYFKNLRALTLMSMLIAISVISSMFYINIGTISKMSFGFIINAVMGFFFGPVAALLSAGVADFIVSIVRPLGAYNFWFTASAMVAGLIHGVMLYKKDVTIKRVVITRIMYTVICSIIINTALLHYFYGNPLDVLITTRITKGLVLLPIESTITYLILKKVDKIYKKNKII